MNQVSRRKAWSGEWMLLLCAAQWAECVTAKTRVSLNSKVGTSDSQRPPPPRIQIQGKWASGPVESWTDFLQILPCHVHLTMVFLEFRHFLLSLDYVRPASSRVLGTSGLFPSTRISGIAMPGVLTWVLGIELRSSALLASTFSAACPSSPWDIVSKLLPIQV